MAFGVVAILRIELSPTETAVIQIAATALGELFVWPLDGGGASGRTLSRGPGIPAALCPTGQRANSQIQMAAWTELIHVRR